jgi:hypothetical protein
VKRKTSEEYEYLLRIVIDGMDVSSVKSVLNLVNFFKENYVLTLGIEFFSKTVHLFDPIKNKEINAKAQIFVVSKSKHFLEKKPFFYRGSLIFFFIKEHNESSVEDFQAIIKELNIPVVKILDTPKEFTYELFESAIKELIGLNE